MDLFSLTFFFTSISRSAQQLIWIPNLKIFFHQYFSVEKKALALNWKNQNKYYVIFGAIKVTCYIKSCKYYDIFICDAWIFNESIGVCYAPTFNKLTRFWRLEKGLYVVFVPQIQSGGGAVNFLQIKRCSPISFMAVSAFLQFSILNHNNWRWSSFAFVF